MGTLKPQSNRPLYSNMVIGTLAVGGCAVTFGTARMGVGGCKGVRCPPIFLLSNLINAGWLVRKCVNIYIYIL